MSTKVKQTIDSDDDTTVKKTKSKNTKVAKPAPKTDVVVTAKDEKKSPKKRVSKKQQQIDNLTECLEQMKLISKCVTDLAAGGLKEQVRQEHVETFKTCRASIKSAIKESLELFKTAPRKKKVVKAVE